MRAKVAFGNHRKLAVCAVAAAGATALAAILLSPDRASAYIGESLMEIPGIGGSWQGAPYKNWVKIEAHYWDTPAGGGRGGGVQVACGGGPAAGGGQGQSMRGGPRGFFSGPVAPCQGTGKLMIAVDKRSPALAAMMAKCTQKAVIPEMKFSESALLARPNGQSGPKPASIPDFFEYRLKNVQFSDCPLVADAPEQAIVISFKDIEWLNYKGSGDTFKMTPAILTPISTTGATKSFVVSWFAVAHDVVSDQCAKVNAKPTEDDYYALMSKADADKERAENAARKISIDYNNGQMGRRGPNRLNAAMLPGIVRDPGHILPQPRFARGVNLDGDDGTGAPPPGICRHRNYRSVDGRQTGIDNQLYTVQGCVPGYQGHKGFLMQYSNEQRRNSQVSLLIQVSGIDNEKNDNSVFVTILHSRDPAAKNADGSKILADYTFRLSNDPSYTYYVERLPGRIVNGVIITNQVPMLDMYETATLQKAVLRLAILPDGSLRGVVAGYQDWRRLMFLNTHSQQEGLYGFQSPGIYHAFKREADGLKDPVTGVCNGISAAYDIEGSPAFIPPAQAKTLVAQAKTQDRPSR